MNTYKGFKQIESIDPEVIEKVYEYSIFDECMPAVKQFVKERKEADERLKRINNGNSTEEN